MMHTAPSLQIVWEQSKYTFIEGEDDIVSICAGPPGGASLSSSITVTDVMIEGMTATCKLCISGFATIF